MKTATTSWKPYMALAVVYLIWGTTAGFIRLGVDTLPSALLPCLRFTLAGLCLVAFCLLKGEPLPDSKTLKTHLVIGLLLFLGGNSIICWTVKYVPTGFSGVLVATTPLWMVWLSAVLPPREKIPLMSLVGILISFVGMLTLLSPNLTHLGTTSPIFWMCIGGLLLMTFCWAFGSIYARKHPTPASLLMSVGLQNLFAGSALIPICLLTVPDWSAIHPSALSIGAVAYLILLGTIVATPCYLYIVKTMPVSVSSTFAYVTPLIAIAFGTLFLQEVVTPTMIIGSAIILSGVVVVQCFNHRQVATQTVQSREVNTPVPHPAEPIRQGVSFR